MVPDAPTAAVAVPAAFQRFNDALDLMHLTFHKLTILSPLVDIVQHAARIHTATDIRIFSRRFRPVSGKRPGIAATGNGGGRQALQEHVVHEYLIALTNKHRFCVAIRRINHRNPVRRQQHLTLHAVRCQYRHQYPRYKSVRPASAAASQPHAVQVIICINLNLLYLLDRCTLVFQFLIDGLCDFIADIRNGRPDFSQVRRKLTVINLRPQLLSQVCFPYHSFEKIQIAGSIIAGPDQQPPRMPICRQCSLRI